MCPYVDTVTLNKKGTFYSLVRRFDRNIFLGPCECDREGQDVKLLNEGWEVTTLLSRREKYK